MFQRYHQLQIIFRRNYNLPMKLEIQPTSLLYIQKTSSVSKILEKWHVINSQVIEISYTVLLMQRHLSIHYIIFRTLKCLDMTLVSTDEDISRSECALVYFNFIQEVQLALYPYRYMYTNFRQIQHIKQIMHLALLSMQIQCM